MFINEAPNWFNLLPGLHQLTRWTQRYLGRGPGDALEFRFGPFQDTIFSLDHVVSVLLLLVLFALGALRFRNRLRKKAEQALVPPPHISIQNVFEIVIDTILGFMANIMGEKNAKKYLPLIGSLAFFILGSNLLALIPGMEPPTASLKTNLALALSVFVITHYEGVKSQGVKNYLKHFMGPILLFSPLFILIELIGHIARPISLSMRLLGNMFSDHKVATIIFGLVPLLVPLPFLVLGTIVAVIQTFVFCLLTTIYIHMAVSVEGHDDHHLETAHNPNFAH